MQEKDETVWGMADNQFPCRNHHQKNQKNASLIWIIAFTGSAIFCKTKPMIWQKLCEMPDFLITFES
ncbi:MAG: hypothetical protein [Caudoviricetes sp.]|nr:MAG: hypothetical protein [Caudoviricetes sp.]